MFALPRATEADAERPSLDAFARSRQPLELVVVEMPTLTRNDVSPVGSASASAPGAPGAPGASR